MGKARGEGHVGDLFQAEGSTALEERSSRLRFEDQSVRAASYGAKLSLAVSQTLRDTAAREKLPLTRKQVAKRMTAYLGEEVGVNILNAYASQARDAHNISVLRMMALMHATSDFRLMTLIAELFDMTVMPREYENAARALFLTKRLKEDAEEHAHLLRTFSI
ncbi:MAG: DNA transposition protein [Alcanivorax sp.]|nr:MAG: DNA transposition protein [Alcanivorax sp.]